MYILMLTFVIIILPVYSSLFKHRETPSYAKVLVERQTLKDSRDNLLALAVNYANNYGPAGAGPGHFPCPNSDIPSADRQTLGPSPPCGQKEFVMGRLPKMTSISHSQKHYTYQPGPYNSDQAFWYAVSGGFVNNPLVPETVVNSDTDASLQIDSQDDIVAVVFDPGAVLSHQIGNRPSSSMSAYLESSNADGDVRFRSDLSIAGNDRVSVIRRSKLIKLVEQRVVISLSRWLLEYRDNKCSIQQTVNCFPFAASSTGQCQHGLLEGWIAIDPGNCDDSLFSSLIFENVSKERHWFIRNQWHHSVRYRIDPECVSDRSMACKPEVGTFPSEGKNIPLITLTLADAV